MNTSRLNGFIGPLTVAGGTLLIITLASWRLMLLLGPSASGAILTASVPLVIAWVGLAAIVAVTRWRATGWKFRLIFLLNSLIVCVPVANHFYESPSVRHAKEAVLRDDLFTMRDCIHQYTIDKGKPPTALDDLVRTGYLKRIPVDPITGKAEWVLERSVDPITAGGIIGVHSVSKSISSDGTSYRHW